MTPTDKKVNKTVEKEALSALNNLADLLKVDLKDSRIAIASVTENAVVRMYDGSLEAELESTTRGTLYVNSPRSPGILIELVDHQRDVLAPVGAIYHIYTFMPNRDGSRGTSLNGDVASVYVGRDGFILDSSALGRANKLFQEKHK